MNNTGIISLIAMMKWFTLRGMKKVIWGDIELKCGIIRIK